MTAEFLERVRRDYDAEQSTLEWSAYLAGYMAGINRFGYRQPQKSQRYERTN